METFFTFFDFFKINPKYFSQSRSCRIIRVLYRLPCEYAQKMRKSSCIFSPASFALLFVQNYAILDLSDKIYTGGWWIPKCCFFTALKSDNAHVHMCTCSTTYGKYYTISFLYFSISTTSISTPTSEVDSSSFFCSF